MAADRSNEGKRAMWFAPPVARCRFVSAHSCSCRFLPGLLSLGIFVYGLLAGAPVRAAEITSPALSHVVVVSGEYAVVGAPWQDGFAGAAWIVERSGSDWVFRQALTADGLSRRAHFGASVSMGGSYVAVGAPWHNGSSGAVPFRAAPRWLYWLVICHSCPTRFLLRRPCAMPGASCNRAIWTRSSWKAGASVLRPSAPLPTLASP